MIISNKKMKKSQPMYYSNSQRIAFVLIGISCLLFTSYIYRSTSTSSSVSEEISSSPSEFLSISNNNKFKCDLSSKEVEKLRCITTPISRVNQYCSSKVVKGTEGKSFDDSDYWILSNLVITIRHGKTRTFCYWCF